MTKFKIGSLFDGSGGLPLAASLCGIEPTWASEVEPYPIAVTRSRFPGMKHLGSVTDINGGEIEPVDIITFGSPCQDLSVAGKRAGLKHEANGDEETTRSGLFMEAVRIIKEMREATNGRYPTFALWENVPGAFSSNKGEDFRTVCEELIKIVEPTAVMPSVPQKGWAYADSFRGDGWSLAYRVFDAQYFGKAIRDGDSGALLVRGTPQRRRRIHLVLDLRGERAGKVLFEREGLRGYFAEAGESREETAGGAGNCTEADDREGNCVAYGISSYESNAMRSSNPHSGVYVATTSRTLDLNGGNPACNQGGVCVVHCLQGNMIGRSDKNGPRGNGINVDTSFTLNTLDVHAAAYPTGENSYIARKFTPTECARLQGFPDNHGHPDRKEDFTDEEYRFWLDVRNTHAAINGKAVKEYTKEQMIKWYNGLHTDSAEYKMWGNGIALPPALYCMQGMAEALEAEG